MQALVFTANHELTNQDVPEPSPRANDVIVQVDAVGICGSDLHAFHGHDPRRQPPLVLGHELAGTVVSSGPLHGKKVVVNPLITCGQCRFCADGRTNLCVDRELIGMSRPGAFAERVAIPERNVIELPVSMDPMLPMHAALAEPAATAVHAVRLAQRIRPSRDSLMVIGGGAVGLLAALYGKHEGYRRIVISETNALRRETAERAGLSVCDPMAKQASTDDTFDVVVDAVGTGATRKASGRLARAGGVVVHVGLGNSESGLDTRRFTLAEIAFLGSYTYTQAEFCDAIELLATRALGDLEWVESRPLADGQNAFSDLVAGRVASPKIVLLPIQREAPRESE